MVEWKRVPFHPADREAFVQGTLAPLWATQYPEIFDAADLGMAVSQPHYHFYEWLVAIAALQEDGYLSLVEKYQFKKHVKDHAIFKDMAPKDLYHLVAKSRYFGSRQPPDLFVYREDRSEWFFCEVKGPEDEISRAQEPYFAAIERMSPSPIRIARAFRDAERTPLLIRGGA